MEKIPKSGFTAKPCNFQGVSGYTLEQYHKGVVICSQFVSEDVFDEFCKQIKITPLIIAI